MLRANLGTALRNIAVPDSIAMTQVRQTILGIQWVHFEGGCVYEESGANELVVLVVIANHMTHVLTQEALNALAELLRPLDISLRHIPSPILIVRGPRLEGLNLLLHAVVP